MSVPTFRYGLVASRQSPTFPAEDKFSHWEFFLSFESCRGGYHLPRPWVKRKLERDSKMHRNVYLIIETVLVFVGNSLLAIAIHKYIHNSASAAMIYAPLLLFQGLWYYRIYIVGHETAHKKLFPKSLKVNDLVGGLVILPMLVPINIYRKIHYFHHGFNRKDEHTSALDSFVIKGKFKGIKRVYCYVVWYLSVFFGGFFIHSLVSVLLFLFVPPKLAIKISPAFKGWTLKDQFTSIFLFGAGIGLHVLVYVLLGWQNYLYVLGYPLLSFAWVLSLLVYIFHYHTTIGDEVRYNVRSVKPVPVISWILMNFNEHATHHQYPSIPWYELPKKRKPLPPQFAEKNQNTSNFFKAILNQLKGPYIHEGN
jgi:fatty acid desaturase